MKTFQKIIVSILIIGLILSLGFNLFLIKPKPAQALDGGGSWAQAIKETVLDAIGWTVSDMILKRLESKIIAWGTGRSSDAMEPFAVSDWVRYFKDAVALGAAKYIIEFRRTEIEPEIKKVLENLGFGTAAGDLMEYHQYAKSTLEKDLGPDRYQRFKDSGYSLLAGGWAGWFSLMKPQNNIFGQVLMAEQARRTSEQAEKEAADKEVIGGSIGYKSEKVTTKTDREACDEGCETQSNQSCIDKCGGRAATETCVEDCLKNQKESCLQKCEASPGIAMETRIKNWGSTIEKSMTNALGKDMARIISADEISELIGVFFSALMNKAINTGVGAFQSLTTTSRERDELKQTYSYQRTFKKEQTAAEIKDIRSQLLAGILKSIQQLSRSIISCEEKEMMTLDDYSKNLSDMFSANVEALYVGLEGVNLKPDFEVLDPPFAPYSVYGYGWGQVPAIKLPSKCSKIVEQAGLDPYISTCRNIKSGLEPNYSARCDECMYDHDAINCPIGPTPPFSKGTTLSESLIKDKQDFYNACRGPYLMALNRCDSCLKKVDEKCGQLTDAEKTACIEANCSNYSNLAVVSLPASGYDFYNKCLIEEKKEACYVCLKEYYMPANFCYQIEDYMARSIVKYPALVKMEKSALPWWSNFGLFTIGLNAIIGDDKGMFIGPADKQIMDRGGECNDNYKKQKISTALICRILPEFEFEGQKVCKTKCQVSEEQLRDITDFSPGHKDCGESQLDIGGHEPFDAIKGGVLRMRGKCCAALWQYDEETYANCMGAGETVESPEEEPEETGVCHDGESFSEFINQMNPDEGEEGYTPFASTNWNIDRKNTAVIDAPLKEDAYKNCIILRSNNKQIKKATVHITEPYCDAYREMEGGYRIYWSDVNGDGNFSNSLVDVGETHPGEALGYCCVSSNPDDCPVGQSGGTFVAPPSDKILCTFDIDAPVGSADGPTGIDPITGEPYKICCNLGPEIQTATKQDCLNAGVPSNVCNKGSRFYTSGLYIIAVPDTATSLGGAVWCACENPSAGCGAKCTSAMCTP